VRQRFILGLVALAASAAVWMLPSAGMAQNGAPIPPPDGKGPGPGGPGGRGGGKGGGRGKARGPSRPTPHYADGHVNLGPLPGEKGVWEGSAGATLATNVGGGLDNPSMYLPTNLKITEVPFQPWARAMYDYRQATTTKDDPHVRCKPSGGPRMFHTPYGFEFLDQPELKRVLILGVGGPHTWRVIYMDGRPHPKDLEPTFTGHQVGHYDGDALIVDSVGFNEKFWLTREGIPSTEFMHLTEKFTRTDYDTLKYEATIDDPGAYTAPWTGGWYIRWQPNDEMYEYVCQDNNRDVKHMFGGPRN
jgi:hypothetical protein